MENESTTITSPWCKPPENGFLPPKFPGNGQWGMGNGQWAMGSGQWAVGNGQWK